MTVRSTHNTLAFRVGWIFLLLILLPVALLTPFSRGQDSSWTPLEEGLDLGRFKVKQYTPFGDSTIVIVRIDPDYYDFVLLSTAGSADSTRRTVDGWCDDFHLTAAINAGMYNIDRHSHIGYLKADGRVINPTIVRRDYRSAAAFGPMDDSLPEFRLYDLDETPVQAVIAGYRNVVQNIRLIKRPGENRWPEKPEKWSEAALGEDVDGRMLMIFCKSPYTMHDFNDVLLSLPIDIVSAQHLEGGAQAQMHIEAGGKSVTFHGTHASGLTVPSRIPNVVGVRKRANSK
jgi:hypothetical protein